MMGTGMGMNCFAVALIYFFVGTTKSDKLLGFVEKIEKEYQSEALKAVNVPTWLNGILLRQVCGAFGQYGSPIGSHIEHMYDCMGSVAQFEFRSGSLLYSNKFYQTKPYAIWNSQGRDMGKSGVAWDTAFSQIDSSKYLQSENQFSVFPNIQPNLNFWRIGQRIIAVSETSTKLNGYLFTTPGLQMQGWYPFGDDRSPMGFSEKTIFINNAAHEFNEKDGTIWSTAIAVEPTSDPNLFNAYRIIYKINQNSQNRTLVGKLKLQDIQLQYCTVQESGSWQYGFMPGLEELGYSHSIAVTENYAIIPSSSYFWNPCMLKSGIQAPVYQWFINKYIPSRFLLFQKKDSTFRTVNVSPAVFVSHMINAWQENDEIIAHMLTYKNADPMQQYLFLNFIRANNNDWPLTVSIERFRMQFVNGQASRQYLTTQSVVSAEYPQINPAYVGKDYNFVYLVQKPYSQYSSIWKLDVKDERNNKIWTPGPDIYPGEPVFVPLPTGTKEDDGVLLVVATDTVNKIGILYILDSSNLKEITHITTPGLIPFGHHSRYYALNQLEFNMGSGGPAKLMSISLLTILFLVMNGLFCILLI